MRNVAILIPASPTAAFFSQIAAFSRALQSLKWAQWRPSIHITMGGDLDREALHQWLPHLDNVALTFLPATQCRAEGIWAQYDGVFRNTPVEADVVLRMDADILPVGDFEEVLDRVADTGCVAGVIEHFPFLTPTGSARMEHWQALARDLIGASLEFPFRYTLLPDPEWPAPFYINFGAVFCAGTVYRELSSLYLRLRRQLNDRLADPYFAGQVAFALAVAELGATGWALPMRYNFPNDERAVLLQAGELERVAIFHYLRTHKYDRHRIFTSAPEYRSFLDAPLTGADRSFQQKVETLLGREYPFGAVRVKPATARRPAGDPLSTETFAAAVAEHIAASRPGLAAIDAELATAGKDAA